MNLYIEDTNEIEMRANQEDEIRLQAGDTINIGGGGGASAFIAEYGVTPYADVKDAYDKDAIIICTVDDSGNTVICQLAYFDDANDIFYFTQPVSEGSYWVSIASDNTWDDGYFQFASTDTATQLRDGLMSALDKQKLDGIESGAEVNVQSDWNATSGDAQILNKPSIPTKTSDLLNNSGFITASDIPPLVTDLGNIDPSEYEDDREVFLNTLLQDGTYRFVWEDGDDYEYYIVVESMLDNGYVYQKYWYSEEGSNILYHCSLIVEDGEVVDRSEENYMALTEASNMFAIKNHSHYESKNAAMSVFDWCDSNALTFDNAKPFIAYTDTLNNKNWIIERYTTVRTPNHRFIRVYDMSDASHFYIRSGSYSGSTTTWGSWKEYPSGGMNITVNGTSYPITAITQTSISGVQGVLVDYDDGNSGQLFFADGVGLNAIKSAIELTIPHDTSELTNGAGFITISDLPIYNGGVS